MIRALRWFVVAFLTVTLSSQLVGAQAISCAQMEMPVGESMDAMSHELPAPAAAAGLSTPVHNENGIAPSAGNCVLATGCVNVTAVPTGFAPTVAFMSADSFTPTRLASISSQSLSPDIPPPRS